MEKGTWALVTLSRTVTCNSDDIDKTIIGFLVNPSSNWQTQCKSQNKYCDPASVLILSAVKNNGITQLPYGLTGLIYTLIGNMIMGTPISDRRFNTLPPFSQFVEDFDNLPDEIRKNIKLAYIYKGETFEIMGLDTLIDIIKSFDIRIVKEMLGRNGANINSIFRANILECLHFKYEGIVCPSFSDALKKLLGDNFGRNNMGLLRLKQSVKSFNAKYDDEIIGMFNKGNFYGVNIRLNKYGQPDDNGPINAIYSLFLTLGIMYSMGVNEITDLKYTNPYHKQFKPLAGRRDYY